MHNYTKMNPTLAQTTILNTFIKSDILTQLLTPPENSINFFKNQKSNATSQTPIQYLHFINILPSQKICTCRDIDPFLHQHPYFLYFQIWTFWPHEPKNSNFTNSFLQHYPQPKLNQNCPKDPKSILILTMKLLYTYFWKTLPTGDLIWLALIWLTFSKSSQIVQPTSNHLKTSQSSWLNLLSHLTRHSSTIWGIGFLRTSDKKMSVPTTCIVVRSSNSISTRLKRWSAPFCGRNLTSYTRKSLRKLYLTYAPGPCTTTIRKEAIVVKKLVLKMSKPNSRSIGSPALSRTTCLQNVPILVGIPVLWDSMVLLYKSNCGSSMFNKKHCGRFLWYSLDYWLGLLSQQLPPSLEILSSRTIPMKGSTSVGNQENIYRMF